MLLPFGFAAWLVSSFHNWACGKVLMQQGVHHLSHLAAIYKRCNSTGVVRP
jgi:hypothetical protein